MKTQPTLEEFLALVERRKEKSGVDLLTAEDLSIAVMNLISLEEHFFFTGMKTGDDNYFDTMQEIRGVRKEALAALMSKHEGETWCISKHLLAATMRFVEVGSKLRSDGKKDEAKAMFERAYKIYSIFWALKLKLLKGSAVKAAATGATTFEDLVTKLAECCDE